MLTLLCLSLTCITICIAFQHVEYSGSVKYFQGKKNGFEGKSFEKYPKTRHQVFTGSPVYGDYGDTSAMASPQDSTDKTDSLELRSERAVYYDQEWENCTDGEYTVVDILLRMPGMCPIPYCRQTRYECNLLCGRGRDAVTKCELHNCTGIHICMRDIDEREYTIPLSNICDGISQCPKSDDERACDDKCPRSCICTGLTVNVDHAPVNSLRIIFKYLSKSVNTNNQSFPVSSSLSYLILVGTPVVTGDMFDGLTFLRVLNLTKNGISVLPKNIFSELDQLVSLDLSNNLISVLPDGIFSNVLRLEYLDLSRNLISLLPDGIFSNVLRLQYLDLSSNLISVLPDGIISKVSELDILDISKVLMFFHLDLSNNQIFILPEKVFWEFPPVASINLSNNKISVLHSDTFFGVHMLSVLNLANNTISVLPDDIFVDVSSIFMLDLSNNRIASLPRLPLKLNTLIISHNRFKTFPTGTFNYSQLTTLDITGNEMEVQENLFDGLPFLLSLYTDTPFMCCVRPKSVTKEKCLKNKHVRKCTPGHFFCKPDTTDDIREDEISSCFALIHSDVLRACLWIIGVCALIGNLVVILYRLFVDGDALTKSHSLFVLNLAISDLLMGVYLLIIGVMDAHLKGVYAWNDQSWRASVLCTTAGVLSTISSEMSTFLILLVTVDRFVVIAFPLSSLSRWRISWRKAVVILVSLWIVSITLSFVPITVMQSYFKGEFYSQSGVCLALPLTGGDRAGSEYSFAVFVCLNSLIFVVVVIGQICIFRSVRASSRRMKSTQNQQREIAVAKTLFLVVATDFCCWFPIGVMGVMSRSGAQISGDVYSWVMVFVLPVNAAINPFLYTATAIWRNRRRVQVPIAIPMTSPARQQRQPVAK